MMTLPKVAVVGAGVVGGSAALLIQAVIPGCEVVIVDIDRQRAERQAMDIAHAGALWRAVHVRAGNYGDVAGSRVIVITAGVAMKPGQSRLDLAKANLEVLTDILDAVAEGSPDATYVIATNPVNVLGYIARRRLGLAAGRVISTGTALDSARLRSLLAERLEIAPGAIHAYVLGEHGDSSMIDWSGATIGGRPIDEFLETSDHPLGPEDKDEIAAAVRKSAYLIKQGKGATHYGIGSAIARICQGILHNTHTVLPVGMTHERIGTVTDVCLSLPAAISATGATIYAVPSMSDEDHAKLEASAKVVKEAQEAAIALLEGK